MNTPKISVILPIYNVEQYLVQCITSVIQQTLTDIEIILVNDGSSDSCGKMIDAFAQQDDRIKPIHQKNGGYGKAINGGLAIATGEYIGIVETDDWIELDMFESLYNAAKEKHSTIVKASFTKIQKGKYNVECSLNHISTDKDGFVLPSKSLDLMIYESSIWSAIYRRDFISENNISMLETQGASYQDVVWKFLTYSLCDKIYLLNKPVYNYRVLAVGSSSASTDKSLAMFENYAVIKTFLDENNRFDEFKESYFTHQIFDCVFHSNRLTGEGLDLFFKHAKEMIDESKNNSIYFEKIEFNGYVNDYVENHVKPLYLAIKDEKLFLKKLKLTLKKKIKKLIRINQYFTVDG